MHIIDWGEYILRYIKAQLLKKKRHAQASQNFVKAQMGRNT
jgi:hypothetical protein